MALSHCLAITHAHAHKAMARLALADGMIGGARGTVLTLDFLKSEAKKGNRSDFKNYLSMVPDEPAEAHVNLALCHIPNVGKPSGFAGFKRPSITSIHQSPLQLTPL